MIVAIVIGILICVLMTIEKRNIKIRKLEEKNEELEKDMEELAFNSECCSENITEENTMTKSVFHGNIDMFKQAGEINE